MLCHKVGGRYFTYVRGWKAQVWKCFCDSEAHSNCNFVETDGWLLSLIIRSLKTDAFRVHTWNLEFTQQTSFPRSCILLLKCQPVDRAGGLVLWLRRSCGWQRPVTLVFFFLLLQSASRLWLKDHWNGRAPAKHPSKKKMHAGRSRQSPVGNLCSVGVQVLAGCLWQRYDCVHHPTTGVFCEACFPGSSTQLCESCLN